jgi:hypothetical protein
MGYRVEEQGALEKVVPLIGRLIPPLRAALNHPDKGVLRAGLKAIRYFYGLIFLPFFCEMDAWFCASKCHLQSLMCSCLIAKNMYINNKRHSSLGKVTMFLHMRDCVLLKCRELSTTVGPALNLYLDVLLIQESHLKLLPNLFMVVYASELRTYVLHVWLELNAA